VRRGMEYEKSKMSVVEGRAVVCVKMIDVRGEKEEYVMIEVEKSGR
jgi:hypothetical protein